MIFHDAGGVDNLSKRREFRTNHSWLTQVMSGIFQAIGADQPG